MRKYYEEPDFKAVIFESSDVIMVSEEDWVKMMRIAGKRVQKAGNKNEKENDLCSACCFTLCCDGNWMQ